MIKINLQFIAYICYFIAGIFFSKGVFDFIKFYGGSDISNLLAIKSLIENSILGVCISIVGYLIFRAFK